MNDSLPTSSGPAPSGVSRRTVVKGAAWAVPVVTLAAAAPAFAGASQCVPEPVLDATLTCKLASAKRYKLVFTVGGDNCTPGYCTIVVTKIQENTSAGGVILWTGTPPAAVRTPPIVICDTNNMSEKLRVFAQIRCGGILQTQPAAGYYLVDMPTWQSTENLCAPADFVTCPTPPPA